MRKVRVPTLRAQNVPGAAIVALVFGVVLPIVVVIAFTVWTRRRHIEEHGETIVPAPGTSSFWLAPESDAAPALLERSDRHELLSGLNRFETSEMTRRLDARATIKATVDRAGSPSFRFKARKSHRRVWVLHDVATKGTMLTQVVGEVANELGNHGLEVEVARFWGLPLSFDHAANARSSLEVLGEHCAGDIVSVLTDGEAILEAYHRADAEGRPGRQALTRLLKTISLWERVAFFVYGPERTREDLAELLARFNLACFGPGLLARFIASEGTLARSTPEPTLGPAWLWAACCAVYPIGVPEKEALRMRRALDLPVSPYALPLLQAQSLDPHALRFSAAKREAFIARLQGAFGGEGSELPPLLGRVVRYWRVRTTGPGESWRTDTTGRGLHRRLIVALLDLWTDAETALRELTRLRATPHFARANEELRNLKSADSEANGIALPFSRAMLSPVARQRLARLGFAGAGAPRVVRGLADLTAALLGACVIIGAFAYSRVQSTVSLAQKDQHGVPWVADRKRKAPNTTTNPEAFWSQQGAGAPASANAGLHVSGEVAISTFVAGEWRDIGTFPSGRVLGTDEGDWFARAERALIRAIWGGSSTPDSEKPIDCVKVLRGGGELHRCGVKAVPETRTPAIPRIAVIDLNGTDTGVSAFVDALLDNELVEAVWIDAWPEWFDQDFVPLPGATMPGVFVFTNRPAFLQQGTLSLRVPIEERCWVNVRSWSALASNVPSSATGNKDLCARLKATPVPRSLEQYTGEWSGVIAEALKQDRFTIDAGELRGPEVQQSYKVSGKDAVLARALYGQSGAHTSIEVARSESVESDSKVSHLVIDRSGKIFQFYRLNEGSWPSTIVVQTKLGTKETVEVPRPKAGTIAVSLVNQGVVPASPSEAVVAGDSQTWQIYPHAQIAAFAGVLKAILKAPASASIAAGPIITAGISRPLPGPAFPHDQLMDAVKDLRTKPPAAATPAPDLDTDRDGIRDSRDKCRRQQEDFDGFQDEDGCPDEDNDTDGVPDISDRCPNVPEDRDGDQDEDGCPEGSSKDGDRDADGIPDARDRCPDDPEDTDGFEDADGCPEPDNDKDGIPDIEDECVDEPETKNGFEDKDGCPDRSPSEQRTPIPKPAATPAPSEKPAPAD